MRVLFSKVLLLEPRASAWDHLSRFHDDNDGHYWEWLDYFFNDYDFSFQSTRIMSLLNFSSFCDRRHGWYHKDCLFTGRNDLSILCLGLFGKVCPMPLSTAQSIHFIHPLLIILSSNDEALGAETIFHGGRLFFWAWIGESGSWDALDRSNLHEYVKSGCRILR